MKLRATCNRLLSVGIDVSQHGSFAHSDSRVTFTAEHICSIDVLEESEDVVIGTFKEVSSVLDTLEVLCCEIESHIGLCVGLLGDRCVNNCTLNAIDVLIRVL